MKRKEYVVSYVVVIVLSLAFIGLSLVMEYTQSKILPLIISGIIVLLAAIGLSQEITVRHKPETTSATDIEEGGEAAGESWLQYARVGAWIVGFFLAVYLLGFIPAIFLFLLSFMKAHGTKWLIATISAVLTTAIVYGLFVTLLKVYLYEGILFS